MPRLKYYVVLKNGRVYKGTKKRGNIRIIVIRSESGVLKNSRPCANCLATMRTSGVQRVTYSTGIVDEPFRTELISTMESTWVSMLQRSVVDGTFKLQSRV